MRSLKKSGVIVLFWVVVVAWAGAARAQAPRTSAGLGGYGAAAGASMGGMGSGALIIPYGGQFAGFMPARMGGGSSLAFTRRDTAAIGSNRRPFALAAMSGGSGMKSGLSTLFGAAGGLESGAAAGMGGMSRGLRSSVAPPSFAYPFYQPPPFFPTTAAGMPAM